jgi:FG-GAP-like repeat/FG-GAP repeat
MAARITLITTRNPMKPVALAVLCSSLALAANAQTALSGCPIFGPDNVWNTRVDRLPVHASSAAWIGSIGMNTGLHMDFGTFYLGAPIGIPFVTVPGTQPTVPITYGDEAGDESDPGPFPIPPDAPIEGGPGAPAGDDRHVIVLDRDNCILYELYNSFPIGGGTSWAAYSGAKFNLRSHALRASGDTSADAAGLPILPGLVRYDEVAAGEIRHALRFTADITRNEFIWPARHEASNDNGVNRPPMGARFRLKASKNISGFSPRTRAIAQAMKTYGIILADNGSNWYISGAHDPRWDDDELHQYMDGLKGSDFEAVDTAGMIVNVNSGKAANASPVKGDVNADTRGDLFWRNTTGGLSWWTMTGNVIAGSNYYDVPTDWSVRAVADLDGDGKADLVWRNSANGGTYYWKLDGLAPTGFADLGVLSPAQWTLAGAGDVNGDGKADLVWRGADGNVYLWLMNGGGIAAQGSIGNPGTAWNIVAIADFDGDGRADIAFRHQTTGQVYVWFMNGLVVLSMAPVSTLDPTVWTLAGAADFNGDGRTDLLWRSTFGDTVVWLLRGATILGAGSLGDPGAGWTIKALVDLDGDGNADLVWRHTDGTTYWWKMNGVTVSSYLPIANPGGTWQITGP